VKLSQVGKSDDRRKAAATGVGAVGVAAGLAGGGVPGTKATRIAVDYMSGPVKHRPGNLVRARRAGAFGQRVTGHTIHRDVNLTPEGIERRIPGSGKAAEFRRASEAGKVAPEDTIIRHLKVGRKVSHGLLGGGAGLVAYGALGRKRREVAKADDRRDTQLVAGGTAGAAGSYAAGRVLRSEGRKWAKQAEGSFNEAARLVPALGEPTVKRSSSGVDSVRGAKAKQVTDEMLRGKSKQQVRRAGMLHGAGVNQSYFANTYGSMGKLMRRGVAPVSAGVAVGAGLRMHRRNRDRVGKAVDPAYFKQGVGAEEQSGRKQRIKAEVGHQEAPGAINAGSLAAVGRGVPKAYVSEARTRALRAHEWAKPRRGRLALASGALGATAVGARSVARWKRDEATGISQELGRAGAGNVLRARSDRVMKGAATALVAEAGGRMGRKYMELPAEQRGVLLRRAATGAGYASVVGLGGGAGYGVAARQKQSKRLRDQGGVAGPVGKADRGSNVREYGYLPENIRDQVGFGVARVRRNPMSALDLFASSRIAESTAALRRGQRLRAWQATGRVHNQATFAGGRAMLYSPAGRGSVF
jgi:hypothetical protein